IEIFVLKVIGNTPYIIWIRMPHDDTVICIDYVIPIRIYITRITGDLCTIKRSAIIDILLRENTVLLYDIYAIHGLTDPYGRVLYIKRRLYENFLLVAYY